MDWKEWFKFGGLMTLLTGGGIFAAILLVLLSIVATAGPIVLVIWVVWKLFFN